MENDLESNRELAIEKQEQLNETVTQADERFVKKIELDKLENNSVLVFKISNDNIKVIMSLPILVKKYEAILKSKNIAILIVGPDEGVETLDEKAMAKLGWVRKEPSLIITPGQF